MDKKKNIFLKMPVGYDRIIHTSILALAVFGLIMVTSATMGNDAANTMTLIRTVIKQLIFTVVGYVGMLFVAHIFSFELCRKYLFWIIAGTVAALLFALFFDPVGGARAWIRIPLGKLEFTIQPSEFAKMSIMIIMAVYLGDIHVQKISAKELLKAPFILVMLFCAIVLVLQSDLGSAAVMFLIAVILFLIPQHQALKNDQKKLLVLLFIGIVLVIFLMSPVGEWILRKLPFNSYKINRFLAAKDPFSDRYGSGYQLIKGLIAFASGGLSGVGFGNSIQKYMNFPAASTDYILAIVVEELGIGGFLFIFIAYMLVICRLFAYALKMDSEKSKMILIGTAMYLFIHYLFNVGGVTGLIPLTGVPLLLISAGGSSTLSFMMAIGLSQAVISKYRQGIYK